MDAKEFQNVWQIVSKLWPNSPRIRSDTDRTIWSIALEPYNVRDVTTAFIRYASQSKFWPDIADITAGLKPEIELPPPSPEIELKDDNTIHAADFPVWSWQEQYRLLCETKAADIAAGRETNDEYCKRKYPRAWASRMRGRAAEEGKPGYLAVQAECRRIEAEVREALNHG